MRHITTLIVLVLLVSNSFSQVRTSGKQRKAWAFQAGPAIGVMDGTYFSPTIYGAILEPKFIFGQMGRKSSVSLGMPVKVLGFSQKAGVDSVISSGFSANIPIVMDFNFFHGAFKKPKHRLGAFIGAGWDFNYLNFGISNREGVEENFGGLNHGPYFNGGIRFYIANNASFDLRGFGSISVKNKSLMIAGVALLYNFGIGNHKSKGGWF